MVGAFFASSTRIRLYIRERSISHLINCIETRHTTNIYFTHILLKMHNEVMLTFSKDHHKVIDVGVKLDSLKYQPVQKCKLHPEDAVLIACTECLELFCGTCDLQAMCERYNFLCYYACIFSYTCFL